MAHRKYSQTDIILIIKENVNKHEKFLQSFSHLGTLREGTHSSEAVPH